MHNYPIPLDYQVSCSSRVIRIEKRHGRLGDCDDGVRNALLNMVLRTNSFSTIRDTVNQQHFLSHNAQTKTCTQSRHIETRFPPPCVQKHTRSNLIHPTQSAASYKRKTHKLFQVSKTIEVVVVKAQNVPCAGFVA